MGYGLQVENGDNDLIIDSDQPYSSFGILSSGSASITNAAGTGAGAFTNSPSSTAPLNTSYYHQPFPSQITGTDLLFVKLPKDGWVSEQSGLARFFNSTHKWVHGSSASSQSTTYAWKEINVMSHANMTIANWNSTYGLNVFKEYTTTAPQQSDLIFSSVAEQGISIVAVGTYKDITDANSNKITVTLNSSDPHYVLVNGSIFNFGIGFVYSSMMGYYFTYSSTDTLQKIDIYATGIGTWGFTNITGSTDTWMIIKVTGDT